MGLVMSFTRRWAFVASAIIFTIGTWTQPSRGAVTYSIRTMGDTQPPADYYLSNRLNNFGVATGEAEFGGGGPVRWDSATGAAQLFKPLGSETQGVSGPTSSSGI